jgi:serpin B
MKKFWIVLISVIALIAVVGCSQQAFAAEQKSDKPRETAPAVTTYAAEKLTEGNNRFALNLYRVLKDNEGNIFYSPYSISEALAMTYGGARGETEKEMASALQFLLEQGQLHSAFNNLDIELAKRGEGAEGKDGEGFRLNVVNAIWGQKGYKFSESYLDLLAQNYGAGMRIVDYIDAAEEARQTINDWVAQQTEDKIKDLLPAGSVNSLTRMVLTNAIYFNAAWANQFEKEATQPAQFTLPDNSTVSVDMMKQYAEHYNYAEGQDYQVIELPYDGRELSMLVLLPAEGKFTEFESTLDDSLLNTILAQLQPAAVNLSMPKFEIKYETGLAGAMRSLGMQQAFIGGTADFSGMTGNLDLYITDILHKAFISVDEAGTEAAAATGVVFGTSSMPTDIKDFTMDRPFIFMIKDNPSGQILFLGRVTNPQE